MKKEVLEQNLTGVNAWLSKYTLATERTRASYERKVNVFFSVCEITTDDQLYNFNDKDLNKFYSYVKENEWSHNYIVNTLTTIKLLFTWLFNHKYIENNVLEDVKIAVDKKDIGFTPTIDECDALLESIKRHSTSQRNYVITRLFLSSGLRRSALFNAKVSDLGLNYIKVREKGNKFKKQPLPLAVVDEIKHYINTERQGIVDKFIALGGKDEGYIFVANFKSCRPTSLKMWEQHYVESLKMFARKAGIERWEEMTCHALRRTYGTTILKETKNLVLASKLLGHSSVAITAQRYTSIEQDELEKTAQEYNPISVLEKSASNEDKDALIKQLLAQQQAIIEGLKKLGVG